MKRLSWRFKLGAGLVFASVVLFAAHYLVFRDFHHIAIYTVHDLAFLPIEVLIVTMILHALLERRARQELLQKLNMVIGAFFSEVGSELLRMISAFDADVRVREDFLVKSDWDDRRFAEAKAIAAAYDYGVDAALGDLAGLRDFLVSKRDFLLRLLENPNLLEHDSFTDTLWAVFHLAEELEHRADLGKLTEVDLGHLSGDIKRAYAALAAEWLDYIKHLKRAYPYLYSLAVRLNPLDPTARAEVAE